MANLGFDFARAREFEWVSLVVTVWVIVINRFQSLSRE